MVHASRRAFLQSTLAAAGAVAIGPIGGCSSRPVPATAPRAAGSWMLPSTVRITSITRSTHYARHPRKIGLNSVLDHPEGHDEGIVRVQTSVGVEGIGTALPDGALGMTLGQLLEVKDNRLCLRATARPLIRPAAEAVLVDLVGKLTGKPAAELLGPIVRTEVPCYDGSIYMRDITVSPDILKEDVTNGLVAGHRYFKVKIGRGNWLKDRAKGYERDLWALGQVRAAAGKDGILLADANNYYNLDESIRLMKDTAANPLFWFEEPFPEDRENWTAYRTLRRAIQDLNIPTLLADGESGRGNGDLLELLRDKVVQVSQPDIHTIGLFAMRDYAELIAPFGALIAPHAWAKQIGVVEIAVLGMVVPNFSLVEDCRLTSEVLKTPNLKIFRGQMTLAPVPGLGFVIDEAAWQRFCAPNAKTVRI